MNSYSKADLIAVALTLAGLTFMFLSWWSYQW